MTEYNSLQTSRRATTTSRVREVRQGIKFSVLAMHTYSVPIAQQLDGSEPLARPIDEACINIAIEPPACLGWDEVRSTCQVIRIC